MRNALHPFFLAALMLAALATTAGTVALHITHTAQLLQVDLLLDHALLDGPDEEPPEAIAQGSPGP